MAILNSEQIQQEIKSGSLVIDPFKPERIKHGAYELSVGAEYYHTAMESGKATAQQGTQITIPPGQLAILITKEMIKIPADMFGFISIKFSEKIQGLINVSGFHVDAAFHGRLKFSVYNAGSREAVFNPGQELFTLWLTKYGDPVDERGIPDKEQYNGKHQDQIDITGKDVEDVQGVIASPGSLLKEIEYIKKELYIFRWLGSLLLAIIIPLAAIPFGKYVIDYWTQPQQAEQNTATADDNGAVE